MKLNTKNNRKNLLKKIIAMSINAFLMSGPSNMVCAKSKKQVVPPRYMQPTISSQKKNHKVNDEKNNVLKSVKFFLRQYDKKISKMGRRRVYETYHKFQEQNKQKPPP